MHSTLTTFAVFNAIAFDLYFSMILFLRLRLMVVGVIFFEVTGLTD
jgi:hypothetical protein